MNAREIPSGFTYIRRRRTIRKKNFLFRYFTNRALITFLIVFLLVLSLFFVTQTFASDTPERTKTVTSVCIESGDSLWSIASSYYTTECGSMKQYVAEIKKSNGLSSDTIHAGAYIIVPYYR